MRVGRHVPDLLLNGATVGLDTVVTAVKPAR
jgi:hypothetical protein